MNTRLQTQLNKGLSVSIVAEAFTAAIGKDKCNAPRIPLVVASDAEGNSFHTVSSVEFDREHGLLILWPNHDYVEVNPCK